MVYKFRVISNQQQLFLREYEIAGDSTFLQFHRFIQDDLDYDTNLMASFFLADEEWSKGLELTLLDMGMDENMGSTAITMESATIAQLIKETKDRLLYVFDLFTDNSLFMELVSISEKDSEMEYPICSASVGEPPLQFFDGEFNFDEDDLNEFDDNDSFDDLSDGMEYLDDMDLDEFNPSDF